MDGWMNKLSEAWTGLWMNQYVLVSMFPSQVDSQGFLDNQEDDVVISKVFIFIGACFYFLLLFVQDPSTGRYLTLLYRRIDTLHSAW